MFEFGLLNPMLRSMSASREYSGAEVCVRLRTLRDASVRV
jgi:hypothetical protein